MSFVKQLSLIGLSEKESKVYIACLELGASSIKDIAKRSGVNRVTAYRIIEELKDRGLVNSLSRNKKGVFVAEDVSKLVDDYKYRERTLEDLVPQLRAIATVLPSKPKVRYYEGEENIKKLAFDSIQSKGVPMYMWATYDIIPFFGKAMQTRYTSERVRNRVYIRVITHKSPLAEDHKRKGSKELREVRYYKNQKHQFNIDIYLHGNKMITFNNYSDLFGLTIESKELYEMMKAIFLSNWDQLDP